MQNVLAVQSVIPFSIVKSVLCLLLLLGWARWATIVDKDAAYFYLKRRLWNVVQLAAALAAFAALLLVPIFPLGLLLGLAMLAGGAVAYIVTRNGAVPESDQWNLGLENLQAALLARKEQRAVQQAALKFPNHPPGLKTAPTPDDEHYDAHMALDEIVLAALSRNAQRIEVSGSGRKFDVQLTVDGIGHALGTLSGSAATAMIDYLKTQCGMDTSDHRRKQLGHCTIHTAEHGEHELRAFTSGSTRGMQCTMIIDPVQQVSVPFDRLGLVDSQRKRLEPILDDLKGLVLVTAPAHQGRTTTLYSLLERHDPYTMDIHTLEPFIERDLEGLTQHHVSAEKTAKQLDSLLLHEPDVVTVASVNDQATARSAARGASDGRRIYVGLRAEDNAEALNLWHKAVGDADLAARGLVAVLNQRLLRRLCPYCRQPYRPDPNVLRKLNLPAERIQQLYKAGGEVKLHGKAQPCPACAGIGYAGRVAAFEVWPLDQQARQLVRNQQTDDLRVHLRRNKMLWLQEAALAHVVAGVTSVKEVTRVISQQQPQEV